MPGRFVDPDLVTTHFHIKPGESVADLGAGVGYFIPALARAVGVEGTVFACEIQRELVEKLGNIASEPEWGTVVPVWGDLETLSGTKLPDLGIDVAVIVNTLFLLEDKEVAGQEIVRILRPGGRLYVIDWTESEGGLGPAPGMVVNEAAATALFETNGFVLERTFPAGDHHYGLAFRNS